MSKKVLDLATQERIEKAAIKSLRRKSNASDLLQKKKASNAK